MISSSTIPFFPEITDLYAAAGLGRAPRSPDFDLIALKPRAGRSAATGGPGPHRRGFFQVTYLLSADGQHDTLLAAAPEQVLEDTGYLQPTVRGRHGFTVLFQAGVLAHQLASPANEFPFLCLPASLALPVPRALRRRLVPQWRLLETAANEAGPYRTKRLSALLAGLLYDVRAVCDRMEADAGPHRLCTRLACRFEEVVLQHFQTHHAVEDYARLLHVSADHLSAEVKARSGRNARDIIAARLVTEARHLLAYTELNVAEVADRLGFAEATHFTRFFKRHLRETPLAFRQHAQRGAASRLLAKPAPGRRAAAR